MGFFRQEDWSGLPFPSPGDLPDPEIEPGSSALQADTLPSETPGKPQEYWSGLLCPRSGDLPNPGIKLGCLTLQADFFFHFLFLKFILFYFLTLQYCIGFAIYSLPSEPPRKPYHFKHHSNFVALNILVC